LYHEKEKMKRKEKVFWLENMESFLGWSRNQTNQVPRLFNYSNKEYREEIKKRIPRVMRFPSLLFSFVMVISAGINRGFSQVELKLILHGCG